MRRLVTTICLAVAIGTTGSVMRANADPPFTALASSSYHGKFGLDEANDLVVDTDGFVYLAGWSESETDLDGFVVKLTPDGSQLVYATRIGGTGFDVAVGLAVDPSGGVVVVGQTESADFPLANALQADLRGGFDSWVARLDDAGAIVYASYYGGSSYDNATAIAVGPSGAVYVTGSTGSRDLPGAAGAQPSYRGGTGDAFVAKISPDGSTLMYATYLGGAADDFASHIAVDATDHAYVVGGTGSPDFPMALPLQVAYGGGYKDGFVTSISPSGAKFVFSTYLGGSDWDQISGVHVDASGRVYLTGMTWSTGFPTQNAYQPSHAGGLSDAFVARLAPGGLGIEYATLLGGSGYDVGVRIVADADGHAHVAGETDSPTFPLVSQVQDQVNGTDAFYARLSPDGASLLRSTPLGGSGADVARGLAVVAGGDVWIGGSTDSQDFPVVTAFQPDPGGSIDAFVSRLTFTASSNQPPVAIPGDDQVVFTAGCDAVVTLDGSRSSDPDGDPLQFVWSGPTGTATGAIAVMSLPPGLHTFTLTVDDGRGAVATRSVNVTVIDNAGPEIATTGASPNLLWPPNHRMVDVTIDVALRAACDASTTCQIVDVISSERVSGTSDDDVSPDWEVTGALNLRLRAERGSSSEERVYSITIECADQSGNTTRRTVTVSVPSSNRPL